MRGVNTVFLIGNVGADPELEGEWRELTRLRIYGIPMTSSKDIKQFWEFA